MHGDNHRILTAAVSLPFRLVSSAIIDVQLNYGPRKIAREARKSSSVMIWSSSGL
jgi:hypothetical protein